MKKQHKRPDYMTPAEIIETYPDLKYKLNWGTSEIGVLHKCRLLIGYYDYSKRVAMIEIDSLEKLVEFTNQNIESQKFSIERS